MNIPSIASHERRMLDTSVASRFLHREAEKRVPRLYAYVSDLARAEGIAIAYVTEFELRRGLDELGFKGQGKRRRVNYEKFMSGVEMLGLDAWDGGGWRLAAQFWAVAKHRALGIEEADLLIGATASFHDRILVTADEGQAESLKKIHPPFRVELLME